MDPERTGGIASVTIDMYPVGGKRRGVFVEVDMNEPGYGRGEPDQEAVEGAVEEAMAMLFRKDFKCEQIGE